MASAEGTRTRRREKGINFRRGIERVLKQVHPELGLRSEALEELNAIALHVGEKISCAASTIVGTQSKTIKARAIDLAAQAVLHGELGKGASHDIAKAVGKYKPNAGGGRTTGAEKAGLQISVPRAEKLIRKHAGGCMRVSAKAGVALAAAIEYVIAELVEVSGNHARDNKKVRISVKSIRAAVLADSDMNHVLGMGVFSSSGVDLVHLKGSAARMTRRKASRSKSPRKSSKSRSKSPSRALSREGARKELRRIAAGTRRLYALESATEERLRGGAASHWTKQVKKSKTSQKKKGTR